MALVGTFGMLVFTCSRRGVHTFSDLRVSNENRFATHDVHLEMPVLEFVGPGLTQVAFKMNFNSQWGSDPIGSLMILREYVRLGAVAPLLVGMRPVTLGANLFVCKSCGEDHKWFDAKGVLFGASVDVNLAEYRVLLS